MKKYVPRLAILTGILFLTFSILATRPAFSANVPPPLSDAKNSSETHAASIVLAGGCFWGMQEVFEHLRGVSHVTAGYAGGSADTAHYEMVSTGSTGHAESVKIDYDPSLISLGKILQVYFSVAHDPTELNRQTPDSGTQYRSSIFVNSPEQDQVATAYIKQLNDSHAFSGSVVTSVSELKGFYPAESYHQDFAKLNPHNPYIAMYDAPKVSALKNTFPELYVP